MQHQIISLNHIEIWDEIDQIKGDLTQRKETHKQEKCLIELTIIVSIKAY